MSSHPLLSQTSTNTETLLLGIALQQAAIGSVDFASLDADGVATALFAIASQLEAAYPGICARHDWAQLSALRGFAAALNTAAQATPPDGLR